MKRFFVTFLVLGLFVGTVYAASEKDLAVSLVDKAAAWPRPRAKKRAWLKSARPRGNSTREKSTCLPMTPRG